MTISYYYAQIVSVIKGLKGPILVIACGNGDEGLSGYFTKYDCSSGDLSPISSICKNDLRRFIRYFVKNNVFKDSQVLLE
jgi:NAD+ synthase (glutamine-hydrolysing)